MHDRTNRDILVVTTTVGAMADAQRLARELVQRRLAACVQVEPVAASFYRWEGELHEEPEVRVSIKTLHSMRPQLEKFFGEHHPYELPQFLCETREASGDYAAWVRKEVAPGS